MVLSGPAIASSLERTPVANGDHHLLDAQDIFAPLPSISDPTSPIPPTLANTSLPAPPATKPPRKRRSQPHTKHSRSVLVVLNAEQRVVFEQAKKFLESFYVFEDPFPDLGKVVLGLESLWSRIVATSNVDAEYTISCQKQVRKGHAQRFHCHYTL